MSYSILVHLLLSSYPGHVGIEGKEEADAADNPEFDATATRPEDAKVAATTSIINVFQRIWIARHSKVSAVKQSVHKC